MSYFNKTNVSEGLDINKSDKSKECMICHYCYFLDLNYSYEPELCHGYNDISMMAYELENIAILNVKGVDYWFVIWSMTKNDGINMLNNSTFDDEGLLWIWILVQIKHLLK